jgi:outer membrane protein assembly factor BamD
MIFSQIRSKWAVGVLLALSMAGAFHGCAGKTVDEGDPASLLADAEDEIKSDHYQIAIDKLKEIKNKFPYSKFSIDAQLRLADVYFLQESYADAAAQYESFRDLHPKHERVAYAMFRIAKSYYNDAPSTIERDMTPAKKALDAYADFLHRFPASPDVAEANTDVADLRAHMAEKEMYIADFYFKRKFFESSRPRYQKVVDQYSDTPSVERARSQLEKLEKIATNAK